MTIEVRPVQSRRDRRLFLTFPWHLYKNDPLWVPPLLSERQKNTDPKRGAFFKGGYAEFLIAWQDGKPVGTICCAEETNGLRGECMLGFFECVQQYAVAEALFQAAERWARQHHLNALYGTYNLDREDGRGVLVEGYDRPAPILCGHNPPYYSEYFERYGFGLRHDDGVAYAITPDLASQQFQRLALLAERVRQRRNFTIRSANLNDVEGEVERIWELQNQALQHLRGFEPYPREAILAMVLPLKDLADPDLVLFAEADGKTVGWFPAVPNFNEVLIHLNGLRYPWNYVRLLRHIHHRPESISIKSVAVLPEYWDTGVAILLFDEMVRRAIEKGYRWVDLSLTGVENPDTWELGQHMQAKIYKRYRFYRKSISETGSLPSQGN